MPSLASVYFGVLSFSKYHGLGNDFILFDDPDGRLRERLTTDRIKALCHRHTGIGADGILIRAGVGSDSDFGFSSFVPSRAGGQGGARADHCMLLFNADGSSAEISGNGLRCFVLFLKERGYDVSRELTIETGGGIQRARLVGENIVESTMPAPFFPPALAGGQGGVTPHPKELAAKDMNFIVLPVTVGNPHGVIFGPERDIVFAETYGPGLEKNAAFPEGANIEFVHVRDRRSCQLVVWERGAGITLACGSGSVATACAGAALGHFVFDQPIAVHQPGGTLEITVAKDFSEIRQRGPAQFVFRGEVEI